MKHRSLIAAAALCAFAAGAAAPPLQNQGMEEWEPFSEAAQSKNRSEFPEKSKPRYWNAGEYRARPEIPTDSKVFRDTAEKHGGACSVRIENATQKSNSVISRWDLPIEPKKYYRATVWMKARDLAYNPRNIFAGPNLVFATGPKKNFWGNQHAQFERPKGNSFGWTKVEKIFYVPEGDDALRIAAGLQFASGTLWVDDLTLEESDEKAFLEQEKAAITAKCVPTHWRVHYGPDARQVMNLYLPKSDKPTPLWIEIHGGGWLGGDGVKASERGSHDGTIRMLNAKGVAVAVVNYRLGLLPNPVHDAARAVQFLRHHAAKYNLDKSKFVATGFSAGATTSLWLALHDDMADPKSADPIARESSKLQGAVARGAQTSIDPKTIAAWGIEPATNHAMIFRTVGIGSKKEIPANYEAKKALYTEFSPITHLDRNDPKVYLINTSPLDGKDWIHHTRFGYEFKKKADAIGAKCDLVMSTSEQKLVGPVNRDQWVYIFEIFGIKR